MSVHVRVHRRTEDDGCRGRQCTKEGQLISVSVRYLDGSPECAYEEEDVRVDCHKVQQPIWPESRQSKELLRQGLPIVSTMDIRERCAFQAWLLAQAPSVAISAGGEWTYLDVQYRISQLRPVLN